MAHVYMVRPGVGRTVAAFLAKCGGKSRLLPTRPGERHPECCDGGFPGPGERLLRSSRRLVRDAQPRPRPRPERTPTVRSRGPSEARSTRSYAPWPPVRTHLLSGTEPAPGRPA